jgi:hypothetical protein
VALMASKVTKPNGAAGAPRNTALVAKYNAKKDAAILAKHNAMAKHSMQ